MRDKKRIVNSQNFLGKYFLTAGEMSNIVTKIFETFNIDVEKEKQDENQEILGSKKERITSNVEKNTAAFEMSVILTKSALPNKDAQLFLDSKVIGQVEYDKFLNNTLTEEQSMWNTMTKVKLSTFAANNKMVKITMERKILNIRAERNFMTRLLKTLTSCTDIDSKKYLRNDKFLWYLDPNLQQMVFYTIRKIRLSLQLS